MAPVRASLLAFALALTGATVLMTGPTVAAGASTFKSCGTVTVSGHTVHFSADSGVSCSTVKKYAKALAQSSLKSHSTRGKVSGGPKGWTCIGSIHSSGGESLVVGNCSKGLGFGPGAQYFNWSGA